MKKINKLSLIVICLVMLVNTLFNSVYAQGNVSYEGQSDGFIFTPGSSESVSDLFENFKDIVPGDTLTDKIEVKNNSKQNKKVKIYLKASDPENKEFLSNLNLVVKNGSSELFNSTTDKTTGLDDWVLLGELNYGDSVVLDLQLSVDIEMDNKYQEAIGYLNWTFKVEDDGGKPAIPKTGIDYFVEDYSIYAICLVLGIFLYYFYKQYRMKLGNK